MCVSGRSHNLMSLDELVKDSVEPLKQKAEQRLDELSVLMKETTQTINHWDTETDETVTLIHNTRDQHVRALLPCQWLCFRLRFFSYGCFPTGGIIQRLFFWKLHYIKVPKYALTICDGFCDDIFEVSRFIQQSWPCLSNNSDLIYKCSLEHWEKSTVN